MVFHHHRESDRASRYFGGSGTDASLARGRHVQLDFRCHGATRRTRTQRPAEKYQVWRKWVDDHGYGVNSWDEDWGRQIQRCIVKRHVDFAQDLIVEREVNADLKTDFW